jgi:hypothetical protein
MPARHQESGCSPIAGRSSKTKAQRSYPPRKSSPGFAPWTRRLGAILGRVSPSPKQLSPLFLSRTGSHRSARPQGRTKAVRSGTGPTLRTLGGGICDWRAIFLSEPFTPFTALNNKRNPAFGPFTRVKGCDPEIVNDFNEVNRVKGKNRLGRGRLEAPGESPGLKPKSISARQQG